MCFSTAMYPAAARFRFHSVRVRPGRGPPDAITGRYVFYPPLRVSRRSGHRWCARRVAKGQPAISDKCEMGVFDNDLFCGRSRRRSAGPGDQTVIFRHRRTLRCFRLSQEPGFQIQQNQTLTISPTKIDLRFVIIRSAVQIRSSAPEYRKIRT
jgi:hypothetical protein